MQENQIGFSLAELLFTIVITVILVTVAFVSYQSYIKSARLREAQTMLLSNARFIINIAVLRRLPPHGPTCRMAGMRSFVFVRMGMLGGR